MSERQDDAQVQQSLERYHQIAQGLHDTHEFAEIEAVLEPITSLPTPTQVAVLKALVQEHTVDAADVVMAINTLSTDKEVRKEARRALVRLENANTYPEWIPPAPPTLTDMMEINTDDGILSELQSLMAGAGDFFTGPAYMDAVADFIEGWSQQNYEQVYDLLATDSPLREDLTREQWIERRTAWNDLAHPTNQQVNFIHELTDDEQQSRAEVAWSLEYVETPVDNTLPELPLGTAVFKETGRHWFWTSYTLVEEDDEWRIHSMTDEGANALQLPTEEIQSRIAEIVAIASERIAEDDTQEDDEDEDDDDIIDDDENDEDDDDDDIIDDDEDEDYDEDEEDEEDDEEFGDTLQRMEEAIRITTKGMHYNDALIAQTPQASVEVYQQAFSQAMAVNEPERAAYYLQRLAENFPEQRGLALQELALTLNTIVDTALEEADVEKAERFTQLSEQALREAIAAENAPSAYILLADLLMDRDDQLQEATALLDTARSLTSDSQEITLIEAGLAEIAQMQDQPEQALAHYQKVTELAPDYPDVWFNMGTLYHQLKRDSEAIQSLQRSIKTSPSQTGAHAELGAIYAERNELGKAREILLQGLGIDPESTDLLSVLSLSYIQGGDLRSAEKYLQQAEELLEEDDEEGEIVHNVRQILEQQKAQQKARQGSNKPKFKQHKKRK